MNKWKVKKGGARGKKKYQGWPNKGKYGNIDQALH